MGNQAARTTQQFQPGGVGVFWNKHPPLFLSLSQLVRDVKAGEKESEGLSLGLEPAPGYLWVDKKFLPKKSPQQLLQASQ